MQTLLKSLQLFASKKTTFQLFARCGSTICQTGAHHLKCQKVSPRLLLVCGFYLCSCVFHLISWRPVGINACVLANFSLRFVCLLSAASTAGRLCSKRWRRERSKWSFLTVFFLWLLLLLMTQLKILRLFLCSVVAGNCCSQLLLRGGKLKHQEPNNLQALLGSEQCPAQALLMKLCWALHPSPF